MKDLRIIYLGTPDFSAELLRYLIEAGYNIIAVVTQGDSPVGRKRVLTPSPVKTLALAHNIPVFTPLRIRKEYDFIVELEPDLILTFAYGQIVPKAVLEAPKYGCLNFHGSILPKYRGASPIQMALINAEEETGVSLMEMVEAMDAGRVFGIEKFKIEPSDNFITIASKMVKASATLIEEVLPSVISGENKGVQQEESQVTFAPLLKIKDEWINLENDDVKNVLFHYIGMKFPGPGDFDGFFISPWIDRRNMPILGDIRANMIAGGVPTLIIALVFPHIYFVIFSLTGLLIYYLFHFIWKDVEKNKKEKALKTNTL
jgi:methionyl-tRNA formyltransferase